MLTTKLSIFSALQFDQQVRSVYEGLGLHRLRGRGELDGDQLWLLIRELRVNVSNKTRVYLTMKKIKDSIYCIFH